jgi:hypothetical protein
MLYELDKQDRQEGRRNIAPISTEIFTKSNIADINSINTSISMMNYCTKINFPLMYFSNSENSDYPSYLTPDYVNYHSKFIFRAADNFGYNFYIDIDGFYIKQVSIGDDNFPLYRGDLIFSINDFIPFANTKSAKAIPLN